MRAASIHSDKITDPRKLLMRRYQMMAVHFGFIVALIIVSTFEVRSGILLGIHCTSAALFLLYVPGAGFLSWRDNRWGAKVGSRRKGGRWTWDCAGMEVGYLIVQLCTTLVSGILCSLTLSSQECYGHTRWALDEFAEIKERDVDDWCDGVIGATVLSWAQFGLDLIWLSWVYMMIKQNERLVRKGMAAGAGVGESTGQELGGGQEAVELRDSLGLRSPSTSIQPSRQTTSTAFPLPLPSTSAASDTPIPAGPGRVATSATASFSRSSTLDATMSDTTPRRFTLLTPIPRILVSLALYKHATHVARMRRLDPRNRPRHVQRAPERRGTGNREGEGGEGDARSDDSSDRTLAIRDIEAGENVPGNIDVPPAYDSRKAPAYPGV